MTKPAHHRGTHQVTAKRVTDAAYRDPTTTCRRCGLTLAERRETHPTATWDAGHPDPGQTGYAAECSHCNRSAGAAEGNRRRNGLITSRNW